MKENTAEYYVYVYIDPRNFEEFYYGKGKANRKDAHLKDNSDSEKSKRIKAIQKAGLSPIIKVIAKELTERQAFLIEKTLIWKLGKNLTNQSSGHFAEKFRPHDTMHLDLAHFDFKNGLYYVNVGECEFRNWDDCKKYGFLSAGQHKKYSDPIRSLVKGDIVVAYLKGNGYVGIGRVKEQAVRVNDFKIKGKLLNTYDLKEIGIYNNCDNDSSEFPIRIEWLKSVNRENAKWKSKDGIFSSQLIKASLQAQPRTIKFLEEEFDINFNEIMLAE
ncbi:GIY-YIG nuclease family protein [Tenacibaculum finnmarkense]|uniref:GIY-YIG nuclease family protein n=1 Tax=Tenacibaculum finnmarkense TaxID=2781243 RepID=UPI001E5C4440|nr:GIY-YIG nuclease family protein [Tenacibaculum finnmarkense]MCD8403924.1 GIY-YIG nuclease family protein [Tenacibaculum finnmarkense genomovar finnmarkense]